MTYLLLKSLVVLVVVVVAVLLLLIRATSGAVDLILLVLLLLMDVLDLVLHLIYSGLQRRTTELVVQCGKTGFVTGNYKISSLPVWRSDTVQGGWGGWPTGNGTKVSSCQAQLSLATCLAVA